MARDTYEFNKAYQEVKDYVRRHRKAVWLVPRELDYAISCIKPERSALPSGTVAVLYDDHMGIIDRVPASDSTSHPETRAVKDVASTKPQPAIVTPAAWFITCPRCDEGLPSPSGSLMWTPDSFKQKTITCDCGAVIAIPRRLLQG